MSPASDNDFQETVDFIDNFEGKKKRRTKKIRSDEVSKSQLRNDNDADTNNDSSRDYTYDELLALLYEQRRKDNPVKHQDGIKFKLIAPLIETRGQKSTIWKNFIPICEFLHRKAPHVSAYILRDLSTTGSFYGNCELLINSCVTIGQVVQALVRYTKEYVLCRCCKSSDTMLERRHRQGFVVCSTCHHRSQVDLDKKYNKLNFKTR